MNLLLDVRTASLTAFIETLDPPVQGSALVAEKILEVQTLCSNMLQTTLTHDYATSKLKLNFTRLLTVEATGERVDAYTAQVVGAMKLSAESHILIANGDRIIMVMDAAPAGEGEGEVATRPGKAYPTPPQAYPAP